MWITVREMRNIPISGVSATGLPYKCACLRKKLSTALCVEVTNKNWGNFLFHTCQKHVAYIIGVPPYLGVGEKVVNHII